MLNNDFKIGDQVRIRALQKNYLYVKDAHNQRRPKVGDIAKISKVFNHTEPGLQLSCEDFRGDLIWQLNFSSDEIELETVKPRKH